MDISAQQSPDEDRVMQRQLYRAGQTPQPAAPKPVVPVRSIAKKKANASSTNGARILQMILLLGVGYYLLYGTDEQRKRVFKGLAVAVWLLFLGGVSYCIFLPDLDSLAKELREGRREIWSDKSLTMEQKKDKMRELDAKVRNLTPEQRKQLRKIDWKERERKGNKDTIKFLQLTPEQRYAETKKWVDEMEKRRAQWGNRNKGKNGDPKGGGRNGNGNANAKGGPGGGGRPGGGGGGGGGWGGGGGGGPNLGSMDGRSPESRANGPYRMGLMQQMGGFGGGKGGGKR